jgi:hypothetical protein
MRSRIRQAQTIALAALMALTVVSCEDNAVVPPDESTLSVFATPPSITIDTASGETEGSATIHASVFNSTGKAAAGVDVAFITSAGTLASNPTAGDLVWIKTDGNGYARDVLTMQSTDPAQAEVTALSGTLQESVTVTKAISSEASALISANPPGSALYDEQVIFSGAGSTAPVGGQITCYKWTIQNTAAGETTVQQSPDDPSIERIYQREDDTTSDLDLVVTLRVSDLTGDPDYCPECGPPDPPSACGEDNSTFSPNLDEISYTIICDDSPPDASLGATPENPEAGETVRLAGIANETESEIVSLQGYCQAPYTNPFVGTQSPLVWTCEYDLEDDYEAKFVATNSCGQETEVFLTITVTEATAP